MVSIDKRTKVTLPAVDGQSIFFYHSGRKKAPTLNDANITVEKGVIYGLLGPSGCGKTTLLRCIVGRHRPASGSIKVYGRVPGESGFCIPGRGVGYMPQELALYPEISTEETLNYFGRLYQMDQKHIAERIPFLIEFLDIPDKKKLIKNLSGGQQRRVSFAAALIHKPPLLILDEPTVGVDPVLRQSIWYHLKTLAEKDHLTIIITTHYVEEARQANVVGLMRNGHLLSEMNPEKLIEQHRVSTLEEVFLKLCKADPEGNEDSDSTHHLMPALEQVATEDPIWVIQEEEPPMQNVCVKAMDSKCEVDSEANCNTHEQTKALLPKEASGMEFIYNSPTPLGRCKEASVRLSTLINKNFVRLKRNIPLAFFQLFVPSFQVIVFCVCVGGEPFDLPLAVVNMESPSSGVFATQFLAKISNTTFSQKSFENLTSAIETVKNGETWGAMYIGPQFTTCLIDRFMDGSDVDNATIEGSEIKLYLDMTNQQIGATVYTSIMRSFQLFATEVLIEFHKTPLLAYPPVKIEEPIYGELFPNFTEFMAPGMILGIVYIMAVGLTSMSIIIEKKEGLLDRSWVAGVTPGEVMFSISFTLFIVMLAQVALVLLFTFLAFSIPVKGPVFWVIICVLLVGVGGMAYGLFISAICNDENIAMMIAMGSFYPNLLLSGIIWPVEAMPYYLRYFSYSLPLTLIANSMRSILSRGWTITDHHIWDGYLVSLAWIVILVLLSGLMFRYKK